MSQTPVQNSRSAFRYRDYRLYVSARFLWTLSQQIMGVATAWFIYEQTQDPLSLGLIGLATFLPSLPLSLLTGPAADRYDRRMILVLGCGLMSICAAIMVALIQTSFVWPLYVIVVVLGSARAFTNPAGQALMMNIVPDDEFTSAVSWNNSITQSATIIGPGLGGLLYPLGATVPFIVAFVFFTAAVLFALNIVPRPNKGTKPPITFDMLVAGYRYIWGKPVILGSITLDLVAVLLGGATALLPVYARDIFFAGPWALGVLRATPSVGSILAALTLAHRPMRKNVGLIRFISVFIYGLATIGFALSTHILVAMLFLVILGAADMVSVVIRQTFIQVETPNEMRGRVIAVHTILTGTSNQLGDFESGTLAHFVGAVNSVLIGGIGALGATGLWMYLFPSLRNRQSFEAEPREEQIKSNP